MHQMKNRERICAQEFNYARKALNQIQNLFSTRNYLRNHF